MKIAVIGTGNVGVAFAADLSIKGHEVTLLKTSSYKSDAFDRLIKNGKRVFLKEKSTYIETAIKSNNFCSIALTFKCRYNEDLHHPLVHGLRFLLILRGITSIHDKEPF